MRYAISVFCLAVLVVVCWPPASAQQLQLGKEPGLEVPEVTAGPGWKTCPRCQNNAHIRADKEKYKVEGHAFDPHDLSGVWGNNGISLDLKSMPPLTAYGKQLWDATQAVQVHPEIPPGNGGEGSKDPMLRCDPLGYPRSFTYNYGFELVHLPDRVIQFFEWGNYHRTIWTDGRKIPADPPQPRWYGYNVGHWEGDTLVVESNGFDDRSWLVEDQRNRQRGMPHSDEMKLVERYKRTSYGNLQIELTIVDPKVYEKPWITIGNVDLRPGTELGEYYCVPSDSEQYNREVIGGQHADPGR